MGACGGRARAIVDNKRMCSFMSDEKARHCADELRECS
jgi:hypothetical protein